LLIEKVPFGLCCAVMVPVTVLAEQQARAFEALGPMPLSDRLAHVVLRFFQYGGHVLLPVNLAIPYPFPRTYDGWQVALSLLVPAALVAVLCVRKKWHALLGLAWFYLLLLPVIGFGQIGVHYMADRYLYLPQIGIYVALLCPFLPHLSGKVLRVTFPAATAILISCVVLTERQLSYWRSDIALFGRAVAVTRDNYIALNNLAWALVRDPASGRAERLRALSYAQQACALTGWKTTPELHTLATAQFAVGFYTQALETLDLAIQIAMAEKDEDLLRYLSRQREAFLSRQGQQHH
jgi:hypothetical protein